MSASAWGRRHRAVLVLSGTVLAVLVALSVLSVRTSSRGGELDPENPSADGAQAVARVLADHGVQVAVVRRAAQLDRTAVDSDTTVLVTSSQNLGRATAQRFEARAEAAGAVVLATPAATVVRALALPLTVDDQPAGGRAGAGCPDPLLSGLQVEVPRSSAYHGRGGTVVPCFTGAGQDPASWVVRVDRGVATYVVGADALFSNARVDQADNAAAALRLLGQHDRLVWYVPDTRDVASGDTGSFAAQLPGGLVPALWLMAASLLAAMLWRGRRLGPLVVEPLPVVVKAVESTQGRGRLYRRVGDRAHAATILRTAAARRLAAHLRLPVGTDHERLVTAVADATARDRDAVHDLLLGRPVADDRALTLLAADLAALDREVHRP